MHPYNKESTHQNVNWAEVEKPLLEGKRQELNAWSFQKSASLECCKMLSIMLKTVIYKRKNHKTQRLSFLTLNNIFFFSTCLKIRQSKRSQCYGKTNNRKQCVSHNIILRNDFLKKSYAMLSKHSFLKYPLNYY